MENNYLKYFLNEGIYVIKEPQAEIKKPDAAPTQKEQAKASPEEATPEPSYRIKGKADSKNLILVFEETSDFLPPAEEKFLKNILNAVNLQLENVAVINLAKITATLSELEEELDKEIILTFGLPASLTLPGNKKYEVQSTGNSQILLADSLDQIEADKSLKKALWSNLQQLFLK